MSTVTTMIMDNATVLTMYVFFLLTNIVYLFKIIIMSTITTVIMVNATVLIMLTIIEKYIGAAWLPKQPQNYTKWLHFAMIFIVLDLFT